MLYACVGFLRYETKKFIFIYSFLHSVLNVKSEIKSLVLGLVNFFSLVLIGGFLIATLLAIISIPDRYIFVFFLILPFIPILFLNLALEILEK